MSSPVLPGLREQVGRGVCDEVRGLGRGQMADRQGAIWGVLDFVLREQCDIMSGLKQGSDLMNSVSSFCLEHGNTLNTVRNRSQETSEEAVLVILKVGGSLDQGGEECSVLCRACA